MLWLKRNIRFNEVMKCDVSDEAILPGDFYYIDDVDGIRIKASVYKAMKDKRTEEEWDYSKLNAAENEVEYKRMLREATRQMLASSVLDRKVAGRYDPHPEQEDEIVQDIYDNFKRGDR